MLSTTTTIQQLFFSQVSEFDDLCYPQIGLLRRVSSVKPLTHVQYMQLTQIQSSEEAASPCSPSSSSMNEQHQEPNMQSKSNSDLSLQYEDLSSSNSQKISKNTEGQRQANSTDARQDALQIVRQFRAWIKDMFVSMHGNFDQRGKWGDQKLKEKLKLFFCNKAFKFNPDFYAENEIIFATLIFHRNAQKECFRNENKYIQHFAQKTLRDVFGSKPNQMNLQMFFSNQVISTLWQQNTSYQTLSEAPTDNQVFFNNNTLKSILEKQTPEIRQKFGKYMSKIEVHYQIFPSV